MNEKQTIVAIDPGASGGIAILNNGRIQAVKMPESVQEMQSYFNYINDTFQNVVVFIEKVQAYGSDDDDTPGKKFGINKMLANYQQVLTVIQLTGFRFVEVYPISWQTTLGLKLPKSEGTETKTQRKNRYKDYAQKLFPEVSVNLKTCDALCLIQFAKVKIQHDIDWIRERLQNVKKEKLF
jgi:hypothetical protein